MTDEDTPATIAVLENDADVDGDGLIITAVGEAANGVVVLDGDSLVYTPDADFNGDDSFTYTISDGNGGSDTATVSVTVNAVNDDPEATDDDGFSTAFGTPLEIDPSALLGNDTDVDGDVLSVASVGVGVGGTAVLSDGVITFTPDAGFDGTASFDYTVSDGNGGFDTATVSVLVETTPPPVSSLIGQWLFDDPAAPGLDGSSNDNTAEFRKGAGAADGVVRLDGQDDHVFIGDLPVYDLQEASIRITFTVDELDGTDSGQNVTDGSLQALFSRDGRGFDDGGHVSALVDGDGSILIRHQTADESFFIDTSAGIVTEGEEITLVYEIREGGGATLFVEEDDALSEIGAIASDVDLAGNDQPWVLGASQARSRTEDGDRLRNFLDGEIADFQIAAVDEFAF